MKNKSKNSLCTFIGRLLHLNTRATACLANETARHAYAITKLSAGAISSRWLLGKLNSSDSDKIEPTSLASNLPIGVITDTASASGEFVAVELLGAIPGTIRMVASEAIAAGVAVYGATSGKIQDLPSSPGTYYQIGQSTTAAAAAGDLLEVVTCVPRKLVVEDEP